MSDRRRTLYDPEDLRDCQARIDRLSAESRPEWGSMTVAQMLAHCSEIQEVANGKPLENTPLLARLFKGMIRKMVVSGEPYKKGVRTHPQYLQRHDRDFEIEKARLLKSLEAFAAGKDGAQAPHPLFGPMSEDEKGWSSWKHLDHHLTQFGV